MPVSPSVTKEVYARHLESTYEVDPKTAEARYDFSRLSGIRTWKRFQGFLYYLFSLGELALTIYAWYHGTPWPFLPSVFLTCALAVSVIWTVLWLPSRVAIFRAQQQWFPITLTTLIALCLTRYGLLLWLGALVWSFTNGHSLPFKAFLYKTGGRLLGFLLSLCTIAMFYGIAYWINGGTPTSFPFGL